MCIFLPNFQLYLAHVLRIKGYQYITFKIMNILFSEYDRLHIIFNQYRIPIPFWRANHKLTNLIIIQANLSDTEIQANRSAPV